MATCKEGVWHMTHALIHAHTWHHRLHPVDHTFKYSYHCLYLDIDDLADLDRGLTGFGWKRRLALYRVREEEYLGRGGTSLREKVETELLRQGVSEAFPKICLITAPRFLGYVFNPVSFYYCYRADGSLGAFIAEVNNTFRDKHTYVLPLARDVEFPYRIRVPKAFHVSPFFSTEGEFAFEIQPPGERLYVVIDYWEEGRCVFRSGVRGSCVPLTQGRKRLHTISRPFMAWLTMPRILFQAARLYYVRRLPVYTRPNPESPDTVRHAPATMKQRWCLSMVSRMLCRIEYGSLVLRLPDETELMFPGTKERTPRCSVTIKNYDTFVYLMQGGDVGAGEAYEAGYWDADDLTAVLSVIVKNHHVLNFRHAGFSRLTSFINRFRHLRRKNSILGSRRNIEAHYDLSNEFFESFLDPSMTYSSALYRSENDSLEDAQRNKLLSMVHKATISAEHHVLEIGCGWGSFAMTAVQETGCRVTCLTLSKEQKALAEQRIADAGLEDRIQILLEDYRHHQGSYDRIVSVEMLEAVGKKYLPTYFSCCNNLLARNGIAVLQVITLPEERRKHYARSCDWIQKYIFPGCYVPAISEVVSAAADASLSLEATENIALHYAKTLRTWREVSDRKQADYIAAGHPEWFLRRWRYYLAYCEAGFATRMLGTHQLVLSRQQNAALGSTLQADDYVSAVSSDSVSTSTRGAG